MLQLNETTKHVENDVRKRKQYLEEAFNNIILDLTGEINELQGKILLGVTNVQEKIQKKQVRIEELIKRKDTRLQNLEYLKQLSPKAPEVLGCAYVVPLTKMEYESHYGMSRDEEVEAVAMEKAMAYETDHGWIPTDVSKNNEGFDIRSVSKEGIKRYIEVKGRAAEGGVMLSENEMNRLAQLGSSAWLYVVMNCKSYPELFVINNPALNLKFEIKTKGIQYLISISEWKNKFK